MVASRRTALVSLGAAGLAVGVAAARYKLRRSPLLALDEEILSHLEVGSSAVRVVVVSSPQDWAAGSLVAQLRRHLARLPVLGLDCEWVSEGGAARPVCLLQLATCCGLVLLVRLHTVGGLPTGLREILAAPEVFKVGVAVSDDARKLVADYGLDVASCVDLRHLVLSYREPHSGHPGKLGLEALAERVLGVALDKDWRLRAGDWEAVTLEPRQVEYAANDALVAVNILWVVLSRHFRRSWLRTVSSVLWGEERLQEEVAGALEQWLDLDFSNRDWKNQLKEVKERSLSPRDFAKGRDYSTRKSPLYHNCMLQAPDGQVLCTCDTKKAEWYIAKGIGYMVSEDPFTVRLRFEPSGRPEGKAGEYYLSVKPNICVVCGQSEAYLRKNVIPHEYRRYFPAVMKDHQSHDVLLMCVRCHQVSNIHDGELRKALAHECEAPVGVNESVKLHENFELKKIRSAGRALQANRKRKSIPAARLAELEAVLLEHFGLGEQEELTDQLVDQAASENHMEQNGDYIPHSRAVVQHYLEGEGLSLLQFETRWRKHFLATMKPRYLPDLWSVNHQAERLEVKAKENRIDLEQYRLATEGVDKEQEFDLEEYRNTRQAQLGCNPEEELDGRVSR